MFKILTLNNIAKHGLQEFPHDRYEVSANISHPDAIILRSFNMHDYVLPPTVKVIGRAGAGVNNIPVTSLTKSGIPVLNTPGANANAVRELVLAGMLIAARHLDEALYYIKKLIVDASELNEVIERDKKQFGGSELLGKTLGVVGLGSIGVKVANAALALGMRVIGYDPKISVNRAWELSANVHQAKTLNELLANSDYISFHIPLVPETKNMIGVEELKLLKPSVILLNFSRDGIIDNEALLACLKEKKIFRYVSDFPRAEFKDHERVINLPHLGASTVEAEQNCAIMIATQIRDFLEYGAIGSSVNFPLVELPPNNELTRLTIVNANIPNMVAQISSCLANEKLNIVSLVNKSKENIAYTVVDLDHDVNETLLQTLKNIEGIIQVRKIPATKIENSTMHTLL